MSGINQANRAAINLKRSIYSSHYLRDRSLITSRGGGGGGFGGGYTLKASPFLGGKFFTGKKHEGGQIL